MQIDFFFQQILKIFAFPYLIKDNSYFLYNFLKHNYQFFFKFRLHPYY